MTHNDVFLSFKNLFGDEMTTKVQMWFPNGKNSIRLRFTDRGEYVFTINSKGSWCFETVEHFVSRINRKEKNR